MQRTLGNRKILYLKILFRLHNFGLFILRLTGWEMIISISLKNVKSVDYFNPRGKIISTSIH